MINIFKTQYSFMKTKLYDFGCQFNDLQYSDSYWETKYNLCIKNDNDNPLNLLIAKYIYRCCKEDERRFIDLYFFKQKNIVNLSISYSLSERACHKWREDILKNLIGLGMQQQLIVIEI